MSAPEGPSIPPPKNFSTEGNPLENKATISEAIAQIEQMQKQKGKGTFATTRDVDTYLSDTQEAYRQTFAGNMAKIKEIFKDLKADSPVIEKPAGQQTVQEATEEVKSNPWLIPNMMMAITENLMLLMDMMKDSRAIETKLRLTSMDVVMDLANSQAQNTLKAAEIEAEMYMAKASDAAVKMAVGIAQAGMGFGLAFGSLKGGKVGAVSGALVNTHVTGSVGQIATGASEMILNLMLAQKTMEKAEYEARKETTKGFQEIAQMMLQSAREADQQLEDLITKTLELLRQIDSAHKQAAGFKLQG